MMMIAFYVALGLTVAALVALGMLARSAQSPETADKSLSYALAAVAVAFLIALIAPEPVSAFYKGVILLGLIFTLIATGLLYSGFLPDYAAHAHLLWVYLIYFIGFTAHTRWQLPTPWVLLVIAALGILYWQLSRYLREAGGPSSLTALF